MFATGEQQLIGKGVPHVKASKAPARQGPEQSDFRL
jgi:hypothetical protein